MRKALYIAATLACILILMPVDPVIAWTFAVVGAFIISKWAIDRFYKEV